MHPESIDHGVESRGADIVLHIKEHRHKGNLFLCKVCDSKMIPVLKNRMRMRWKELQVLRALVVASAEFSLSTV